MALFTLADLHLSLSGEKPMDIFGSSWVGFEKRLKEYWEYMVLPEDTVVIPGDISWAMDLKNTLLDFQFIHDLPGKKILMKGNHDYWWASMNKIQNFVLENNLTSLSFLHNNAFFEQGKIICGSRGWMCEDKMTEQDEKILLRESLRFRLSLSEGKKLADLEEEKTGVRPEIICFSHYPVITQTQRENPIYHVLKEFNISRVYYGHLHNWGTKPLVEHFDGIDFTLISSDYRNFTPVRID